MSASEDLQSAVQPAASEALEGFPLSPLQTRAWRRHAERPENTVVGVRLHARPIPWRRWAAAPGAGRRGATARGLPDDAGHEPAGAGTGWARGRSAGRAPAGRWRLGRTLRARKRASAASPLGGKASRYWRSACCWTPPERRSRGCCWRRRRSSSMRPAWWRCCAGLGPAGQASADEGDEALLFQHFSEWANEALAGEDGESASGYWRAGGRCGGESAGAGGRPGRRRVDGAAPAAARAARTPGSQRLAGGGRPAGLDPGRRAVPGRRGPPAGNGATGLGAPVQRVRRAGRTVRRGRAAVPGECPRGQRRRAARRPPGGDPRPGGGSGPARSLCPDWPLAELGFAWLAGELDGAGVAELDCRQPPLGGFLELQVLPHGEGRLASLRVRRDHDGTLAGRLLDAWVECLESIAADRQLPWPGCR